MFWYLHEVFPTPFLRREILTKSSNGVFIYLQHIGSYTLSQLLTLLRAPQQRRHFSVQRLVRSLSSLNPPIWLLRYLCRSRTATRATSQCLSGRNSPPNRVC